MSRVFFTQAARDDLIDIWAHIAADDPAAADRLLDRLHEAASYLIQSPESNRATLQRLLAAS